MYKGTNAPTPPNMKLLKVPTIAIFLCNCALSSSPLSQSGTPVNTFVIFWLTPSPPPAADVICERPLTKCSCRDKRSAICFDLNESLSKIPKVSEALPVDPLFSCQTVCSCSFSGSGCGVKKFAKMSPPARPTGVSVRAGQCGGQEEGWPAGRTVVQNTSPNLPSVPLPRSWVYPACTVCTTELQPTFYPLESTPMSPADV